MVKVGDRVRYLNAVGGGVVVRIAKDIAYVDEDGFETPVLARECVVVEPAEPAKKAASVPASKVVTVPQRRTPVPVRESQTRPHRHRLYLSLFLPRLRPQQH